MEMTKLTIAALAGFLAGVAVSWTAIRSLKAKIKLYETYIHDRIDGTPEARIDAPKS